MTEGKPRPEWTADITNDPDRDFDLYIEIVEGEEYRGRIQRDERGLLVLRVYRDDTEIPAEWLAALLTGASKELP